MEYYNNINNNYEQSKRLYEEYENKLQEKSEIESKIELNANNLKNIASIIENFESSIKANKNINIEAKNINPQIFLFKNIFSRSFFNILPLL